jgi:hypothetical protein
VRHLTITIGGRFLRLHTADGETRVRADGRVIEPAATFERLDLGHGRVALRTLEGQYLTVRPDQGQGFGLFAEPDLTPHAAFEEILWPNGQVSLRALDLTYVGVQQRGGSAVMVNRTQAAATERFFYVSVPSGMVPSQRTVQQSGDVEQGLRSPL